MNMQQIIGQLVICEWGNVCVMHTLESAAELEKMNNLEPDQHWDAPTQLGDSDCPVGGQLAWSVNNKIMRLDNTSIVTELAEPLLKSLCDEAEKILNSDDYDDTTVWVRTLEDKQAISAAAAAMGRKKSPAKSAAARENGKKGGRPPKQR